MTPDSLESVGKLLDLLREKGVSHYSAGEFALQLFPNAQSVTPIEPLTEEQRCNCGHEMSDHAIGSGLCSHACAPEACVGNVTE